MNNNSNDVKRIRDFKEYGYTQAASNAAELMTFQHNYDLIYNVQIIAEDQDGKFLPKSQEQLNLIDEQIEGEKESIQSIELDIESESNDISRLEEEKEKYEELLDNPVEKAEIPTFDLTTFLITTFFLVTLSVYVFLFYVSVVHKAFYDTFGVGVVDTDGIPSLNELIPSILPEWPYVESALASNPMLAFAPFIFFGFGYAIHIFLDKSSKWKYILIALVVIVTFILDVLIALKIENNISYLKELTGNELGQYAFIDIFLVIMMGFVVYIIWSVIFHAWKSELDKRNPLIAIKKKIKKIIAKIDKSSQNKERLKRKKLDLESKIRQLEKSKEARSIPISIVLNNLSQFTLGWLNFINGPLEETRQENLKEELKVYITEFKQEHDISNLQIQELG